MDYFLYRGKPIELTANRQVNPMEINTNIPLFKWTYTGGEREQSYRILVSTSLDKIERDIGDMWDSGQMWNWEFNNTNLRSQAFYSGASMRPNTTYYWKVRTWSEYGVKGDYSDIALFSTDVSLLRAREEAKRKVFDPKNNELYWNSVRSLKNRIQPNGYAPTSLTGAYDGQFVRDSSVHIFALLELKEFELAGTMLRFLLRYFRDNQVAHIPHVIYPDKPPLMTVQVDGAYQFVIAWVRYINSTDDLEMEGDYYEMVRDFTLGYLNSKYFDSELKLLWNPNYEHCRAPYYLSTYDLLTNFFAVEALKLMIPIATRQGEGDIASFFQSYRANIQEGILSNLTHMRDGKRIYGELRFKEESDDLLWGMSFINLSPLAAEGKISHMDLMDNTVEAYEQVGSFMWGDYRVLHSAITASTHRGGGQVIGKGFAWEVLYNGLRGKWNRVSLLHDFLYHYNPASVLAESWNYEPFVTGTAYMNDGGNQEQMAWYVWAQTKIRSLLS